MTKAWCHWKARARIKPWRAAGLGVFSRVFHSEENIYRYARGNWNLKKCLRLWFGIVCQLDRLAVEYCSHVLGGSGQRIPLADFFQPEEKPCWGLRSWAHPCLTPGGSFHTLKMCWRSTSGTKLWWNYSFWLTAWHLWEEVHGPDSPNLDIQPLERNPPAAYVRQTSSGDSHSILDRWFSGHCLPSFRVLAALWAAICP